jgi:serine protease AprX
VRWVTLDAPIVATAGTPVSTPVASPTTVATTTAIASPTTVASTTPVASPTTVASTTVVASPTTVATTTAPATPVATPTATVPGSVDGSQLTTVFDQTLNVTALWAQGTTGQGIGIAVIDTGVDRSTADFKDPATGLSRVVASVNTNASAALKADGYGHGTHVAAIAAGNSWAQAPGAPARGKYVGVAPGASVVNVRVSDDAGRTYVSDVIEGIDWVIANRQAYNIRVLNLSLQSTVAEPASTSYLAAAAERAWLNGILVVVAAGNQGPNQALYPPGNDPFVVTVGAADSMGTPARSDDGMAPWSTYGTTQAGVVKPDVVAPGRHIAANLAPGSVLGAAFPDRVQDGSYLWLSGTSMAAPQVAGVGALAFQRAPGLTNNALKWLLMNTATRVGAPIAPPGQGAGQVDARAAVMYSGTPGVANAGLPISQHLIGPNGATIYTASATTPGGASWAESGWDSTSWSESGWDSSSWAESGWDASGWQAAPQSSAGARLE